MRLAALTLVWAVSGLAVPPDAPPEVPRLPRTFPTSVIPGPHPRRGPYYKGGQHGPALVPGDAAASPLYRRVADLEQPFMPMGGRLTDPEIAALKAWIDRGADWGQVAQARD